VEDVRKHAYFALFAPILISLVFIRLIQAWLCHLKTHTPIPNTIARVDIATSKPSISRDISAMPGIQFRTYQGPLPITTIAQNSAKFSYAPKIKQPATYVEYMALGPWESRPQHVDYDFVFYFDGYSPSVSSKEATTLRVRQFRKGYLIKVTHHTVRLRPLQPPRRKIFFEDELKFQLRQPFFFSEMESSALAWCEKYFTFL
jgi:hypothetical protein